VRLRKRPEPPAPEERYDHFLAAVDVPANPLDADDDLWALLLTRQYDGYADVAAQLPAVPEPAFQELWNGASGARLATQSLAFYRELKPYLGPDVRVLDFGCGWGRMTRFLARDISSDRLFACDPVQGILDECERNNVRATFARSDPNADRLPFDESFDLVFAFSVFTHLSEPAHERALRALHAGIKPGGTLILTVRPPGHLGEPPGTPYHFVAHPPDPRHFQWDGGEMHYGDAVITLEYVRERWAPRFELVQAKLLVCDLAQVVLVLRRT
jgi:SAM-dependent methyltransferase